MQKLAAKYWQPGMVLAKPVENDSGMVLAAKGTQLTEKIISILESRNVSQVYVEGHPVDIPGQNPMALEERLTALDRSFSNHIDNDFMMRIKEMFAVALNSQASQDSLDEEPEKLEVGDDD